MAERVAPVLDSTGREFTVRADAARDVVEMRFAVCACLTVVSRGLTFCCVCVLLDTMRCCGFVAVLVFLWAFVELSCLFVPAVTERVADWVVETVCVVPRFDAARAVSASLANVVWDTDKPRHTAKNSIILFIP